MYMDGGELSAKMGGSPQCQQLAKGSSRKFKKQQGSYLDLEQPIFVKIIKFSWLSPFTVRSCLPKEEMCTDAWKGKYLRVLKTHSCQICTQNCDTHQRIGFELPGVKDAPLAPDFWHSVVDKMKLMVGPKNLNRWINYSVDSLILFGWTQEPEQVDQLLSWFFANLWQKSWKS